MNRETSRRGGRAVGIPAMATLLVIAAIGGCTLLPGPREAARNTFILHPEPGTSPPAARPCGERNHTLLVGVPREVPGFDTPRMAYLLHPDVLGYYADSRWVDTPARMLTTFLVQAMEGGGCWRAVIREPNTAEADFRLDTEDLVLAQEFLSRPGRVRLGIRAVVVDLRRQSVVATRRFEALEDTAVEDAAGGAAAANRAAGKLLPALAAWADQVVTVEGARGVPAPGP